MRVLLINTSERIGGAAIAAGGIVRVSGAGALNVTAQAGDGLRAAGLRLCVRSRYALRVRQ